MKKKNKRGEKGQFYLLAAIIIIMIIITFAAVSNYSKKKDITRLYDLGEELEVESMSVLDYGKYSELDETNMTNLLVGFITAYSDYGDLERIYFIFGNTESITVIGYQELITGEIQVDVGEGISILQITKGSPASEEYSIRGNKVKIIIEGDEYEFKLESGENFYFVIYADVEGETHVVTN